MELMHTEICRKRIVIYTIAAVLIGLMITFWTGKDPDIAKKEAEKTAKAMMQAETEVLAPNGQIQTIDGRSAELRELYNKKPVYLFFWMPWSDASKQQLPQLQALYDRYGKDIYFVVLSLGSTEQEARTFYQNSSYTMPFYTAPVSLADAYNVYDVPLAVMIQQGGRIQERHSGPVSMQQMAYMLERGKQAARW